MKFVLQDIIPFDIGVLIKNPDENDKVHPVVIDPIIPRYSKIPTNKEKKYKVALTDRNPELVASIYEGSEKKDRFPKTKLGEVIISGLKKANVEINRKMLAEIAVSDPKAFTEIAEIAKKA